jgi:hypothetical protein
MGSCYTNVFDSGNNEVIDFHSSLWNRTWGSLAFFFFVEISKLVLACNESESCNFFNNFFVVIHVSYIWLLLTPTNPSCVHYY